MLRLARRLALVATLVALMPVTIVCDAPPLDYVVETFDFGVYYDGYDYDHHHGCWFDCDDEWLFDFDWWW